MLYNIQLFTMNKKPILLLLFIVLLNAQSLATHDCKLVANPLNLEIPNFETGTHTFQRVLNQRMQDFDITMKNSPPSWGYEVAASILFIHNYYDKNSLDFAIRVTPNSTSLFKALFFMSEQAHWKTASIHYVVTSREDLRAGTVTVPDSTNLLLLPEENGELAITHYLNERPWQVKSDRIKIHYYISGIKTEDRFIDMKQIAEKTTFEDNHFTIYYKISNKSQPIQTLHISYILYSIDSSLIVKQIPDIVQYTVSHLNNEQPIAYGFAGLQELHSSNIQNHDKEIKINLGLLALPQGLLAKVRSQNPEHQDIKDYITGYENDGVTFSDSIGVEHYVRLPMEEIILIKENQKQCVFTKDCLNNGGTLVSILNSTACVVCGSRQIYNYQKLKCQCSSEYVTERDGICKTHTEVCGEGLIYIDGICFKKQFSASCPSDQYFDPKEKKCLCQMQKYMAIDGICVPECEKPMTFSQIAGKCVCPSEHQQSNGLCSFCEKNKVWDSQNEECICVPPYYGKGKQDCIICSSISTEYDEESHRCKCLPGFIQAGSFCRRSSIRT